MCVTLQFCFLAALLFGLPSVGTRKEYENQLIRTQVRKLGGNDCNRESSLVHVLSAALESGDVSASRIPLAQEASRGNRESNTASDRVPPEDRGGSAGSCHTYSPEER